MWTRVFEYANSDKPFERAKSLAHLKGFQAIVHHLLSQDFAEIEKADKDTQAAVEILKTVNAKVPTIDMDQNLGLSNHTFLKNLQIHDANKAALEDWQDSISMPEFEAEQSTLVASGTRCAIPFTPVYSRTCG